MHLFIRSINVAGDSRLQRYSRALKRKGIDSAILYWDRTGTEAGDRDRIPYSRPAPTGARWANIAGLAGWNVKVLRTIWHLRRQLGSVHAIDLDSALSAMFAARLARVPIIVDYYDSYPDSRGIGGLAGNALRRLEGWVAGKADVVIIADSGRHDQHGLACELMPMVIENVPDQNLPIPAPKIGGGDRLVIGYLGNLEQEHRGLEDLLAVVEADPGLALVAAGAGALEPAFAAAAARCDRIDFHGKVTHGEGLALMAHSDVIAGFYYLTAANHRYAAPNKYYEHLLLGRPLLTTRGTPPGDKVERHGTGWSIPEGREELSRLLSRLRRERVAVSAAGTRARDLWDRHYAGYNEAMIEGGYVRQVQALTVGERMR